MGSNCSLPKKHREKPSSSVSGDNTDGKRKDSDRSVDSLPYGKNSPPTSAKSSHNEPSSVSQINGETKAEPPTIITPNAKEDNNYLGVGSTAVSPCPSSQTPSPYTTPSSTRLQPSLSPTGLPDLSHYSEEIRALLIGAKTGEIKIPHILKDFYVYICTGHLNCEIERAALIERVFPKIRHLFANKNYDIVFVDMHWGITEAYMNDQCFRENCLEQLKILKIQARVIVLILLDTFLETPRLPSQISEDDLNLAVKNMNTDNKELFYKWYIKDQNAIPPSYFLLPICEYIPSILSDSTEKRQEGINLWNLEAEQMQNALKDVFSEDDESISSKYSSTIIEDEINFILFDQPSLAKRSLLVQKNGSESSAKSANKSSFDEKQENRLEQLKVVLDDNLPDSQKIHFVVDLPEDKIKQSKNDKYLNEFCGKVHENLKKLIENVIDEEVQIESQLVNPGIDINLLFELTNQAIFCNSSTSNSNVFISNQELLNQIHLYLCSEVRLPLIIHGNFGCGKSYLLSKVSQEASNWLPNFSIIYRFASISAESLTEMQVIRSICEQMCFLYGEHVSLASQILVNHIKTVNQLFAKVCPERPLIILIDGLDQVGPCQLDWIPNELPPNLKLVLSFYDESTELQLMKNRFTNPECYIEYPKLKSQESLEIIEKILSSKNRTVTDAQRKLLSLCIYDSPSPLYAQILGHQATAWHSIKSPDELAIKRSLDGLILSLFFYIETLIGKNILAYILGSLSTSKYGLSENEILDILSYDDSLLDRVFSYNKSLISYKRFPYSIWIKAKKYLEIVLMTRLIGSQHVITFKNNLFKKLSYQYLNSHKENVSKYSNALVNYFKGICLDKKKDWYNRQESIERNITYQPGVWVSKRKVDELPILLLSNSNQAISAKDEYLLNSEWLYYKFCGSDLVHFIDEIKFYLLEHDIDKHELDLLVKVLCTSSYPLRYDGSQIFTQLYTRLWGFFNDDSKNKSKFPKIHNIFIKSSKPFITSLLPLNTHILKPVNDDTLTPSPSTPQELVSKLSSYTKLFTIKDDNCHLIAISTESNELTVWNIYQENNVRTLKGVNQPRDVKMIDRHRALVLCNRELKVYNLNTGTLDCKLKGVMNQKMPYFGLHDENCVVALSRNRMYVNLMNLTTGDLVTTFKVGEDRFLNSLLVSANGKICVCGDETQKPFPLLVWDLMNRKLIYDLRIPHHEFITKLSAISDDGHYVVSVCKELNTSSPSFIIVYDLQSGTLFKKWKPESNSCSIAITSQSSCVINGLENCKVLIWDLSTGTKKYNLRGHTAPPDVLQSTDDGNLFLSYDSTGHDRSIRIWTLETGICLSVFTPDHELSCCRLSPDGKSVVLGYLSSMKLHTLLLCKNEGIEQAKNIIHIDYGDKEKDGQEFDVSKE